MYDLELQPTPTLLQVGRLNIPASAGMLSFEARHTSALSLIAKPKNLTAL